MRDTISYLLFPGLLLCAGVGDCLTLKIPNWLTAAIALSFLPMALLAGLPAVAYFWHLLIAMAVLGAGFSLYAAGLFGGGDAKMLAAAALWFGWPALVPFLAYTALAGGVLAVIVIFWNIVRADQEIRGNTWITSLDKFKPSVPYGAAIAAGGILALPHSWWMMP